MAHRCIVDSRGVCACVYREGPTFLHPVAEREKVEEKEPAQEKQQKNRREIREKCPQGKFATQQRRQRIYQLSMTKGVVCVTKKCPVVFGVVLSVAGGDVSLRPDFPKVP